MDMIAILTLGSGILSLLCLLALHFVSPEFQPNWRMVSEYALGRKKWILSLFFYLWGICSILSAILLWEWVTSTGGQVGLILVFISGIGALFGGMFDVKHKLHGLAFGLGVPFLPIGVLLVSYNLVKNTPWDNYSSPILLAAHATWISLVLMAFSMMLLFSGFKKAGIAFGPNIEPPPALPNGVIGINGYFNRFLILCYIGWPIIMSVVYLLMHQ